MRMRLQTKDHVLVADTKLGDTFVDMYRRDKEFCMFVIHQLCREKGVEHISHEITKDRVEVLVRWC